MLFFFGTGAVLTNDRSGTAVVNGGGTATASGRKGEARNIVVTGGGVVATAQSTARSGSASVNGGGVVQAQGQHAARVAVALSGGGAVSVTGVNNSRSGGGSRRSRDPLKLMSLVTTSPPTIRRATGEARVTAGGDVRANGQKNVAARAQVLGGGSMVVNGTKRYPVQLRAITEIAVAA